MLTLKGAFRFILVGGFALTSILGMREAIQEPNKNPETEAPKIPSIVVIVCLVVIGGLAIDWYDQRKKELEEKARFYVLNGSRRPKSDWARLQIGQSQEDVESMLGLPTGKFRTCWYYTSNKKDYVDYDSSDPQVYFDNNLRVRGWVLPR